MCLIVFGWNPSSSLRLLVVANRDEFHARPSAPLASWPDQPQLIAGRDLHAHGTWLGISTQGRVAAITNIRQPARSGKDLRSRGDLAKEFLASAGSPEDFLHSMKSTLPDYGPCNLLLADVRDASHISNQPNVISRPLQNGLYGLSNAALDTPWPKTMALKARVQDWLLRNQADDTAALFAALADRTTPPDAALPNTGVGLARERLLSPAFIAGREYGTRCSSLIIVDDKGCGTMTERRFGPDGIAIGESRIHFTWPAASSLQAEPGFQQRASGHYR